LETADRSQLSCRLVASVAQALDGASKQEHSSAVVLYTDTAFTEDKMSNVRDEWITMS